MNKWKQGGQL